MGIFSHAQVDTVTGESTTEVVERQKLTEEEAEEKEQLLKDGFGEWSRRDMLHFVRGCVEHGWCNISMVAGEIKGKTVTEVRRFSATFWERCAPPMHCPST